MNHTNNAIERHQIGDSDLRPVSYLLAYFGILPTSNLSAHLICVLFARVLLQM